MKNPLLQRLIWITNWMHSLWMSLGRCSGHWKSGKYRMVVCDCLLVYDVFRTFITLWQVPWNPALQFHSNLTIVGAFQLSIVAFGYLVDDLYMHLCACCGPTTRRQKQARVGCNVLFYHLALISTRFLGLFFMSARIGMCCIRRHDALLTVCRGTSFTIRGTGVCRNGGHDNVAVILHRLAHAYGILE